MTAMTTTFRVVFDDSTSILVQAWGPSDAAEQVYALDADGSQPLVVAVYATDTPAQWLDESQHYDSQVKR